MYVCLFSLPPIEILSQGMWDLLKELEGPELKELAKRLPDTILHSRADSTVRKYLGGFKRWKSWATEWQIAPIPAKDYHIALYLQFLADSTKSKSAVEEACNSIAWVHSTAGLPSPTVSPFVRATLEGLQRLPARPAGKKALVTSVTLEEMVRDAEKSHSLSDLRLVTTCLLAYAGFLCFNELVSIRPYDIKIQEDKMILYIPQSKTDQLWKGGKLIIARTGNPTCPVAMLESYLARTKTPLSD